MLKKNLKKKYPSEKVFAIPFNMLNSINNGFTQCIKNNIWNKYDNMGKYIMRYDAEFNPSMVQLIPYVIIQNKNNKQFLVAKRLTGDIRLQSMYSLGFGGHINPIDGSNKVLENAAYRELQEELFIDSNINKNDLSFLGYVRDLKKTPDHLGCVFLIKTDNVSIKEKENLEEHWMTYKELEDNFLYFEKWSKEIIDFLLRNKK